MDYEFDIVRMLVGGAETADALFYLEIVLRTLVMYFYTIFLARMVGHDAIGQLGPFEFVLVIAVGSAAGDPMFYPDVGLLQGIVVITVVIVLHRVTGHLLQRSRRLESMVEGDAVEVIADGRIVEGSLGSGSLTEPELMAQLRLNGVRDVGEVERAYLETNGRLSVFRKADTDARAERSTLPEKAPA